MSFIERRRELHEKQNALLMATHPRLGQSSPLNFLEPSLLPSFVEYPDVEVTNEMNRGHMEHVYTNSQTNSLPSRFLCEIRFERRHLLYFGLIPAPIAPESPGILEYFSPSDDGKSLKITLCCYDSDRLTISANFSKRQLNQSLRNKTLFHNEHIRSYNPNHSRLKTRFVCQFSNGLTFEVWDALSEIGKANQETIEYNIDLTTTSFSRGGGTLL